MTHPELRSLPDDMDRVGSLLRSSVQHDDRRVSTMIGHLVAAGGKRVRPLLAVAAAYSVSPRGADAPADDRVIAAAVACELMHLGSLYHDDVIDEDDTRRGVASVNARWDNARAVLAGDVLLARASALAASLGAREAELVASTLVDMSVGQIQESSCLFDPDRSEADYFNCVRGKTAALMESTCRLGGLEGGGQEDCVEALAQFGRDVGIAFQVIDDVRDVRGQPTAPGSDLVEGVYTLPVIYARAQVPELVDVLRRNTPEALETARRMVLDSGGIDACVEVARGHLDRATDVLAGARGLHPVVRAHLSELAERVVSLGGAAGLDDQPVVTPSGTEVA